jgi:hypothetical protein
MQTQNRTYIPHKPQDNHKVAQQQKCVLFFNFFCFIMKVRPEVAKIINSWEIRQGKIAPNITLFL